MSKLESNTTSLQAILDAVNALPEAGTDLPELTNPGIASDMLSGKQLIDADGNIITGTIATKTSSNLTASGATVTVPSGYYASNASKSVATATQATPSITVSSAGLITASATQSAGYVSSGTKSATKQLTVQAAKTITPTKSSQTAVASGRYTTGTVTVAAIPSQYITTTDATAAATDILSGKTAYVNGSKVTGSVATFDGSYECSGDSTGGGSGGASIETCTFELVKEGMFTAHVGYTGVDESGNLVGLYESSIGPLSISVTCVKGTAVVLMLSGGYLYSFGASSDGLSLLHQAESTWFWNISSDAGDLVTVTIAGTVDAG